MCQAVDYISLWEPASFVRDKYVTPTGRRLHAGYVQRAEARKTYHLIPQLAVNSTCGSFIGDLLHTYDNYFDNTVYIYPKYSYIYIYIYIYKSGTSDGDISFILGSNK